MDHASRTSTNATRLSRRRFLVSAGTAALVLGARIELAGAEEQAASPAITARFIDAWLRIGADDSVTVMMSQSEMGQGISTTLPMALADELGADWSRVRCEWSDFAPEYRHPQYHWMFTGNAESISTFFPIMRSVGAAAREMLTQAAAIRLGIAAEALRVENGVIRHGPSERTLSFGDVAEEAAKLEAPTTPHLKEDRELRLVGRPQPRVDIPAKVDGSAVFGIDVRMPDMLVATVRRAPSPGGRLVDFDPAKLKTRPGIVDVVEIPSGVAAVAKDYWTARSVLDEARFSFAPGPLASYSTDRQRADHLARLASASFEVKAKAGDAPAALAAGSDLYDAVFDMPAQPHATMEPMNCTAHVTPDRCEVWVPTQGVELAHAVARQMTGLADGQITIRRTLLGGGFGRRLLADFVQTAIIVAKAVGKPVKVIWSREEDFRYDAYRPPMTHAVRALLGGDGLPVAMAHRVVSPSHMLYIFPRGALKATGDWARPIPPPSAYDHMAVEGLIDTPYAIADYLVEQNRVETPLSVSVWRTTGHGPNNFVLESAVDELARRTGRDPLAYRLALAAHDKRAVDVLQAVAEMSGWRDAAPAGRARGLALAKAFGGMIAQVAEVSVAHDGDTKTVRCHRVWSAVDIGRTLDPGIAASNIEGGVVWGLSALRTQASFVDGAIEQSNFDQFDPLHLFETPSIETRFIDSSAKSTGVGELGPVAVHAAVCNAIFAATGERIRALPIRRSGYQLG